MTWEKMNPIHFSNFTDTDAPNIVRYTWEDDFPSADASVQSWLLLEIQRAARMLHQDFRLERMPQSSGSVQFSIEVNNTRILSWALATVKRGVVHLEIVAFPDYWAAEHHPELSDFLINMLARFLQNRAGQIEAYQPLPLPIFDHIEPVSLPPIQVKSNYNRTINTWAAEQLKMGRDREDVFQVWARERNINLNDRTAAMQARDSFKKAMQRAQERQTEQPTKRGRPRIKR